MAERLALDDVIRPAVILAQSYASRRQHLEISEKTAGQFVSEADLAIEASIRESIAERFGDVAIIGEEQGGSLGEKVSGWAIDPIDGTTNFLRGLPMWGISVGLMENGKSVAGVMALPDLNLIIVAEAGTPARANGHALSFRRTSPGGRLVALGENDRESGRRTDARAEKLRANGYTVVRYRSAVFSLAHAALGGLDGYVEHGCCLWDIAAASVICREAGLSVAVTPLENGRFAIEALV